MQERLKEIANQQGITVSTILKNLVTEYLSETMTITEKIAELEKRISNIEKQIKTNKK